MLMRFALIFIVIAIIAAVFISGVFDPAELIVPESTSVDGAMIRTGLELNDENQIIIVDEIFEANQDFYIHFDNNGAFNSEQVIFQLVDTKNDKILAQENYEVSEEESELYSLVFFSSPGLYRIVALVGEEIRATREVIIKD
jgi:hypothetical protein